MNLGIFPNHGFSVGPLGVNSVLLVCYLSMHMV